MKRKLVFFTNNISVVRKVHAIASEHNLTDTFVAQRLLEVGLQNPKFLDYLKSEKVKETAKAKASATIRPFITSNGELAHPQAMLLKLIHKVLDSQPDSTINVNKAGLKAMLKDYIYKKTTFDRAFLYLADQGFIEVEFINVTRSPNYEIKISPTPKGVDAVVKMNRAKYLEKCII